MIMSSSLYAKKNNASNDIYSIVRNSPVGELCDVDIREYRKGVFTVTAACTDSNGKEARSFVTKLHRDDLYRLCIVDNTIYSEKDCINKLDPKKGEEFSQKHTDIVNHSSLTKTCKSINVYKIHSIGDLYNVYAMCTYYERYSRKLSDDESLAYYIRESYGHPISKIYKQNVAKYFVREKDLGALCDRNGKIGIGKVCWDHKLK